MASLSTMEGMGMIFYGGQFQGRRVLLTGHTGFKGSWLVLWLTELGAKVTGVALSPATMPNHWDLLAIDIADHRLDIRNLDALTRLVIESQPEIVFHLAAQPLVRHSYREPLETWSTNVLGTANLLEACRKSNSVRAIVVVTTDKCYENREWLWGYRENDRLGGHDPYSASKASAELVVASYRSAFFASTDGPLVATARAGNVIGGGDWSEDRLIPDLVRAVSTGKPLEIRSPNATRPWQHVLESLSGYLMLGQKLLEGRKEFSQAWNFGPEREGNQTVAEVLAHMNSHWPAARWLVTDKPQPHEANLLYLDSSKAHNFLGWRPVWQINQTLAATAAWYQTWFECRESLSRQQITAYGEDATQAGAAWIGQ